MLRTLYPVSFQRYSSLAIFGAIVDGFSTCLVEQRYNRAYLRHRICLLPYIEAVLIRRGIRNVKEIGQADWDACRKSLLQRFPDQTGTTRALERYLHVHNLLTPPDQPMIGEADKISNRLRTFFRNCARGRGFYHTAELLHRIGVPHVPQDRETP